MERPRPQRPARAPTPPRTQAAGGKTPAPNYPRKQEQRGALRAHESDKAAKAPKSAASPLGGVAASLSDSRVQQSAAASRSRPATSSSVATHTPTRSTPSQQKRPTTAAAGGGVAGMRRTSAGQLPRVAASSTAKSLDGSRSLGSSAFARSLNHPQGGRRLPRPSHDEGVSDCTSPATSSPNSSRTATPSRSVSPLPSPLPNTRRPDNAGETHASTAAVESPLLACFKCLSIGERQADAETAAAETDGLPPLAQLPAALPCPGQMTPSTSRSVTNASSPSASFSTGTSPSASPTGAPRRLDLPPSLAAAMAAPAPTTSDTSPNLAADLNGRPQGDEVQPSATPVESPSSQLPAAMKPAPLLPAETLARSGFALLQQGSAPPLL